MKATSLRMTMLFAILLGLGSLSALFAHEEKISSRFGFGFQLNQYQQDFGLGINITSPYFLYEKVAVRLRGNMMFNEHLDGTEMTWTPYSNFTLGLIGSSATLGGFMRLYGEGGIVSILPDDKFSSEDHVLGGYGLFGFEFYMTSHNNYFIEIGGMGTGATEDKIPTKPIYSNGLMISTGFRIQL